MDIPVKPQWRVNLHPRFPVLDMGEFMVTDDGPRETILRNMKYERLGRSLTYRLLRPIITKFLVSPTRDRRILAQCKIDLEAMKEVAPAGQQKENLGYELRALEAFERGFNALDIAGINLERAAPAWPLKIEGVSISVQPTAHIRVARPKGRELVGAIIVDLAKGTTPKTEVSMARVTEGMIHAAILIHRYAENMFSGQGEKVSAEHCVVFHAHRHERACAPNNYKTKFRNIEAVCRNIVRSWDSIVPPMSFDQGLATIRK
jgi:hypothetical protein